MPVDVIMVAVERTKAAKLFQMFRHNILTVGKHLCHRGSSGKVIMGLWGIAGLFPFFSFLVEAQELVNTSWVYVTHTPQNTRAHTHTDRVR